MGAQQLCPGTRCGPAGSAAATLPKNVNREAEQPAQGPSRLHKAEDQMKGFPSSPVSLLSLIINWSVSALLAQRSCFKHSRGQARTKPSSLPPRAVGSYQREAKQESISSISVRFLIKFSHEGDGEEGACSVVPPPKDEEGGRQPKGCCRDWGRGLLVMGAARGGGHSQGPASADDKPDGQQAQPRACGGF